MCYYVNNMKRIIPAILLLLALTGCYNSGEPREPVSYTHLTLPTNSLV